MAAAMAMAGTSRRSPGGIARRQVVVLLSDGRLDDRAGGVVSMASQFRSMGRDVYTIGLGLDVDGGFMRLVATAPNFYFEAPTEVLRPRRHLRRDSRRVGASSPCRPPRSRMSRPPTRRTGGRLVRLARWGRRAQPHPLLAARHGASPAGMRLRYKPGLQLSIATRRTSAPRRTSSTGSASRQHRVPVPEVTVRVAERWLAFLPVAYKDHCLEIRLDVALVIDTSNSMRPAWRRRRRSTKPAAACRQGLPVQPPSAGRSGRGRRVQRRRDDGQQPVGDVGALTRALDNLPTGAGTRIDLGLDAAAAALGGRTANRLPAIVLLTDGQPSGTSADDVRAAAAKRARRHPGLHDRPRPRRRPLAAGGRRGRGGPSVRRARRGQCWPRSTPSPRSRAGDDARRRPVRASAGSLGPTRRAARAWRAPEIRREVRNNARDRPVRLASPWPPSARRGAGCAGGARHAAGLPSLSTPGPCAPPAA
ncbi:MAG: vWA domain-containing protein [Anaerolineae bacterium]